jgi:hypothetical protein
LACSNLPRAQGQIDEKTDCAAAATMFLGMVQGLVMQAMAADDFTNMPAFRRGFSNSSKMVCEVQHELAIHHEPPWLDNAGGAGAVAVACLHGSPFDPARWHRST